MTRPNGSQSPQLPPGSETESTARETAPGRKARQAEALAEAFDATKKAYADCPVTLPPPLAALFPLAMPLPAGLTWCRTCGAMVKVCRHREGGE